MFFRFYFHLHVQKNPQITQYINKQTKYVENFKYEEYGSFKYLIFLFLFTFFKILFVYNTIFCSLLFQFI